PLPASGLLYPDLFLTTISNQLARSSLRYRPADGLRHVPRQRFPQLVVERFLENYGVARDLQNVSVEHGIVLAEEICLVHGVHHHGNHSSVRSHYALEGNLIYRQAALT